MLLRLATTRWTARGRSLSTMGGVSPGIRAAVDEFERKKGGFRADHTHRVSTRHIFANNQLRLEQIDVVGFDYDYTLCHYTVELQRLIYDMAKHTLVERYRYPDGLLALQFDPSFAIRGLAIDSEKALLCKISSHQKLSYTGVFRGRQRLSKAEILQLYDGSRHIPILYRDRTMKPLNDLFSVAHACLFADVIQFFMDKSITFEPRAVHEDMDAAIADVHTSGRMHKAVVKNLPKYMEPNKKLRTLLERYTDEGEKLFVLTNSSFRYIDAGLKYMVGDDWRKFFEITLVSAKKPDFYTRYRTFRLFDVDQRQVQWQAVTRLEPNCVYTQGSLRQLIMLKGWGGRRVLYIGDSLFSDLVEPNRILGWRTGAIIRELETEISIQSSDAYQALAYEHALVEDLLRHMQRHLYNDQYDENIALYNEYIAVHSLLQERMEALINPNFGSVFRVESHPSQFAFSAQRYVDVYSSRLKNLLEYPKTYTFFPERTRLPHDPTLQAPR
ncbi:hypothetical protein, variant [Saprolegnia diclina VS20]|uniref:5'-nucleotidase domain-containing protein 3 n=1 Tax=Saprolegnia diclina (strain VS20) TaxID=1156394 RepID=T0PN29_SAPDV|nr:hypothetical protein, variant [Saprolegnia diclina VS20]EQC26819.1 hypothetical protein, variant [Saprolegnia diclina VS20]|eukprot:XP_008619721.1 hypothetical protein, variant [Saprolegnia diclina VS20]